MTAVMEGVRVLEVAEHTFVPAASALLADWGAEVIKIEHVERGDAMRALAASGVATIPDDVHLFLEHSNRGKRSLGLDLTSDDGRDVLYRLAETCDVFLTNKLPAIRSKLHIDVDDIRARNPNIIYVRGTGQGDKGPEADRGSYDSLAYWARSGISIGLTRPDSDTVVGPPGPGFGDSIGAMTIAGGIMGALFHRERTGNATVVDVSLLGTGIWSMGLAVATSLHLGIPWTPPPESHRVNPLTGHYRAKDGRWLALTCLQAGKYWPSLVELVGRPDLVTDERFADYASLMANSHEAMDILRKVFAERTADEWRDVLADWTGQWTVVQDTLEVATDPQTIANGYIGDCATASGVPFKLVTAPVQYDETPAAPGRAPEFNEHGDAILEELGLDWDTIIDLKVRGVVA